MSMKINTMDGAVIVANGNDVTLNANSISICLKSKKVGDVDYIHIDTLKKIVSSYHDKKKFLSKTLRRVRSDRPFKSINLVDQMLIIECRDKEIFGIPIDTINSLSGWTGQFNIKFDFEDGIVSSNLNWPITRYIEAI